MEYKEDTTEVVIGTSTSGGVITSKERIRAYLALADDYVPDANSRIVGKIYADIGTTGVAPDARIYYDGESPSHWEIPTNLEIVYTAYLTWSEAQGYLTKAVYDVLEDGFIDGNDTAYAASWDSNINAPSMNAVYDKIEGLPGGHDAVTVTDSQSVNLTLSTQDITADVNDKDYGDVTVSNTGTTWTVEDDSHDHSAAGSTVTINAADITDLSANTDITADLEEETHASEHAVSGGDTVFPADPGADRYLMWDDDPGELVWDEGGGGMSWETAPDSTTSSGTAGDVAYDTTYFYVCVANNSWKRTELSTWVNYILLETGDNILLETGDAILKE